MTNEEILKAAQANASKDGEAELYAMRKSIIVGASVSVVICMITFIIKAIKHKVDYGEFSILLFFLGASNVYFAKKGHSKGRLIEGIVELILGCFFFFIFIGVMFLL